MEINTIAGLIKELSNISVDLRYEKNNFDDITLFYNHQIVLQNDYGGRPFLLWCPLDDIFQNCRQLWHDNGESGYYIDIRSPKSIGIIKRALKEHMVNYPIN